MVRQTGTSKSQLAHPPKNKHPNQPSRQHESKGRKASHRPSSLCFPPKKSAAKPSLSLSAKKKKRERERAITPVETEWQRKCHPSLRLPPHRVQLSLGGASFKNPSEGLVGFFLSHLILCVCVPLLCLWPFFHCLSLSLHFLPLSSCPPGKQKSQNNPCITP